MKIRHQTGAAIENLTRRISSPKRGLTMSAL
jgi:hypothetical protein